MRVFWDVDTQKDFMNKDGKLYVPGAEKLKPNLKKLTKYALRNSILILGSMDRHFDTDMELDKFPPHCMNNTAGQKGIPETYVKNTLYVEDKLNPRIYCTYKLAEIIDMLRREPKKIVFEKQSTDVFTNCSINIFLRRFGVTEAVVYGVATEYCVKDAVNGLLNRHIKVYVVMDAIKHISLYFRDKTISELINKGAVFINTVRVIEGSI